MEKRKSSGSIDTDYTLVLLVKEIMSQLDEFHSLRKQGSKGMISFQLLQEMCSVLPELSEELQEVYFEILISTTTKSEPSREVCHSEEMVRACVEPRRQTISAICEKLGLKAA